MYSIPSQIIEGFPPRGADCSHARILLLGSFPSIRSKEKSEYYGNARNHFWPLLFRIARIPESEVFNASYGDKLHVASALGIMLWDMIKSCRRANSSDSELEIIALNDLEALLESSSSIVYIGLNGGLAVSLFLQTTKGLGDEMRTARKALARVGGRTSLCISGAERIVARLPSTSPVPTRNFLTLNEKEPLWRSFLEDALYSENPCAS